MVFLIINGKNIQSNTIIDIVEDSKIYEYISHVKKTIIDKNIISSKTPVFIEPEIFFVQGIEYHLIRATITCPKHELGESCVILSDLYYRWIPLWTGTT